MSPNSSPSPVAIVLAAGPGTRMHSRLPQALHPLLGQAMVHYPLDLCDALGIQHRITVFRPGCASAAEAVQERSTLAEQAEREGTAGAVLAAESLLAHIDGPVLVLAGNRPLLTAADIQPLFDRRAETGAAAVRLTAAPHESEGLVSLFECRALFAALQALAESQPDGELSLDDTVPLLLDAGHRVETVHLREPAHALAVRDRVELAEATRLLRERVLRQHMLNGVTIEDPATTYIDIAVRIGQDTVLRPMTWLTGKTIIGEECEIGPSVRIANCTLGDRVTVQSAVLAESEVGAETRIGPFAQLRPGCRIGRKVKIGNFVELKKAVVEDRVSIGHLAYVGDAVVGEKSNIGAGTITCNYDGKHKHLTQIGPHTFIGSHTTLVAPVTVGEGAFTAAGTVVTEDVPPDALAIGRARQANKQEWARKRREQG